MAKRKSTKGIDKHTTQWPKEKVQKDKQRSTNENTMAKRKRTKGQTTIYKTHNGQTKGQRTKRIYKTYIKLKIEQHEPN